MLILAANLSCVLPYALPPARIGVGFAHHVDHSPAQAVRFMAGVHSGSGPETWTAPFDIGLGYVAEGWRGDLRAQGLYLELSRFVARGDFWRASLGGRGELLMAKDATGTGLHARLAAELFKQDGLVETRDERCGTSYTVWGGAVGIGVYAEAGAQLLPGGGRALISTAGFTLRVPGAYGAAFFIPGCKDRH